MTDALEDHEGTVSTGGRTTTNLRLRHGDQCQEDQADDNTSGINTEIKVNGQKLETVTSFKYLDSVITDEGSKPDILSRIAQTTGALTRLKQVWNYMSIFLISNI